MRRVIIAALVLCSLTIGALDVRSQHDTQAAVSALRKDAVASHTSSGSAFHVRFASGTVSHTSLLARFVQ